VAGAALALGLAAAIGAVGASPARATTTPAPVTAPAAPVVASAGRAATSAATTGPALVQSTGASQTAVATSLSATFPAPTAAGDLLVLAASVYTGTTNQITSVTDSAAGVWTRIGRYAVSGSNSDGELWYSANAHAVTRVTATTKTSSVMALSVLEFRGLVPAGTLLAATGASASSKAPSSGPLVAPGADLAVGFVAGHASAQAITVTAPGYAVQPQRTSSAGSVASVVTGYQVLAGPGTQSFTGSLPAAKYWAAGLALFAPVPPPDLFSLTAPATATATAGRSTSLTVSTAVTSGRPQPVALSVTGLPAGMSASFSPATVTAGQPATLTLSPSLSTLPGASSLTVTGTGTSTSSTSAVGLTVASPARIRAAFYYPWFPQTWGTNLLAPFTNYTVTRGRYSTDLPTVTAQVADLRYAGVNLGIASWFGQTSNTNANWPVIMAAAQGTGFSWAPYYEAEGTTDPTPAAIVADLHYLRSTYGGPGSPLAILPGTGMPVFVYNADDGDAIHGCATVSRWKQAKDQLLATYGESVYVDLKVFPGYRTCLDSAAIDGWHQYGPASARQDFSTTPGQGSFSVSPGYWKAGDPYAAPQQPFLARDRARWQSDLAAMNASTAYWQLVTTYNEWGEGTAIESSSGCRVAAPTGTYCDWSAGGTTSELVTDLHNAPPT
jgi:hypothetical protein